MKHAILGETCPDHIGQMLGTGYWRFARKDGIHGLFKELPDKRLDILAIHSEDFGKGYVSKFFAAIKDAYDTICVWHVKNPALEAALLRYGFTPEKEVSGICKETIPGFRWDKQP